MRMALHYCLTVSQTSANARQNNILFGPDFNAGRAENQQKENKDPLLVKDQSCPRERDLKRSNCSNIGSTVHGHTSWDRG